MRPSRTHGGRGRTLQRPHPPWPRHSRVGFLLWFDICENNIIGRADNHYFREISFFAMARCSLLGSCYGSVRPCALLLPRKKRQGRGRTLQRPHPCRFFGGQQDAAHPPTQTIPPLARCSLLVSCYGSVRKRPVLLPQTAEGGAGARPQAAVHQPPLPLFGGQDVASPLPHPAAAEGAGWCSSASGRSPACPFRRRCPCSPPRGASLFICFFPMARCSLLFSCYGSVRKRPVLLPQTAEGGAGARPQAAVHQPPLPLFGGQDVASPLPHPAAAEGAGWCSSASGRSPACPFRRRCPCSPPRGASLLICFVGVFLPCSLLVSCYGSMQNISFVTAIAF